MFTFSPPRVGLFSINFVMKSFSLSLWILARSPPCLGQKINKLEVPKRYNICKARIMISFSLVFSLKQLIMDKNENARQIIKY